MVMDMQHTTLDGGATNGAATEADEPLTEFDQDMRAVKLALRHVKTLSPVGRSLFMRYLAQAGLTAVHSA